MKKEFLYIFFLFSFGYSQSEEEEILKIILKEINFDSNEGILQCEKGRIFFLKEDYEEMILVENGSTGKMFEMPIENLRSNLKTSIPYDFRYKQLYKTIKYEGQKYPIYVHPGNKGIPVHKIKFK